MSATLLGVMLISGACSNNDIQSTPHAEVVPAYAVGGTVSGLTGTLNLVLYGTELVTVNADDAFQFASDLLEINRGGQAATAQARGCISRT